MKKILSLLLTLCMLLTCCAVFASCSKKVTEKDVEKDAQEVISEALSKTGEEFFSEGLEMNSVLEKAMTGGSIAITFKSDMILGEGNEINETIYFNGKDKKFVSDTLVKLNGEDIAARLFIDKAGILVQSPDLLGTETTYAIKPATLASDFTTSHLKSVLEDIMGELDDDTAAELNKALTEIKEQYEALFDKDYKEKTNAKINQLYAALKQNVTSEKIEGEKCVIIEYTINNETIEALVNKMIEIADINEDLIAELKQELETAIEDMNESATIDLKAKMIINRKEATITSIALNGTVTVKDAEEPETATINATVTFGASEIAFNYSANTGEENVSATAKIVKTKDGDKSVYTATVSAVDAEGTHELGTLVYTYNKTSGAFTLSVDVEDEDTLTVAGTIQVSDKVATIAVTSVGSGEVTLNIDLTITINKEATMPSAPSDVKDIITINEEEFGNLMQGVMEGPLGMLFGSSSPDIEYAPEE